MTDKRITFDSTTNRVYSDSYLDTQPAEDGYIRVQLACGAVSTTIVTFSQEDVCVRIRAAGTVEFYSTENVLLAAARVPAPDDGDERFHDACCKVAEGRIYLRFPQYAWEDNYPHCDGEHDRWDACVVGYLDPLVWDCATRTLL